MSLKLSLICGTSLYTSLYERKKLTIWFDYIFLWIDYLTVDIKVSLTDSLMHISLVLCGDQLCRLSW